jgi:hypothetical protein
MSLLTENKVSKTLDIPVSLPATEVKQGDWVVLSTIKLVEPMRLTYQFMTLRMFSSSVAVPSIGLGNKISQSLDLAFVGLYRDYVSGHPGLSPALDVVRVRDVISPTSDCVPIADTLGQFITVRSAQTLSFTTPGVYSFILANNTQPDSTGVIPVTTSIDFVLGVTGQIRLELDRS